VEGSFHREGIANHGGLRGWCRRMNSTCSWC
jgi:hypothetical protein